MEVLGCGSFGKVRRAVHIELKEVRAIKTIKKAVINNKNEGIENFLAEINILKSLDHPNILKLYEFYED